ncbi:MAG: hypothetical protein JO356_00520 [Acidobacteria bacterium]|nr:hypothetical protein [Acidobacteriota bacterium]
MRIQLLYVPGCPNYQPTLERVERALASESLCEDVHSVEVANRATAISLCFPGSPTVRVNGQDVEANPPLVPGLACRLYENGLGMPAEKIIRAAIFEAKRKE